MNNLNSYFILMCGCIGILIVYFAFLQQKIHIDSKSTHSKKQILPFIQPSYKKVPYSKDEKIAVLFLTLAYAFVGLFQLGSTKFPTTTWQPTTMDHQIVFELEDPHIDGIYGIYGLGDNNYNMYHQQPGYDYVRFFGSNDLKSFTYLNGFSNGRIYRYQILNGEYDYKYIKMIASSLDTTISELAFKTFHEDHFTKVKVIQDEEMPLYSANLLFDEQNLVPIDPTYYDEGYFDEIYHPRNAWEIANQQYMYAHVHPLFGTSIMAFFIYLFGMSPLAWRIGGALCGILLVPLMYDVLRNLFHNKRYAFLGTLYLCIGFMHLVTSRIGTLEPFSVVFILAMYNRMIQYCNTSFFDTDFKKTLHTLLICGLYMSFGFATKWTVCYSALGLAVLFFTTAYIRKKEYKQTLAVMNNKEQFNALSMEQQEFALYIKENYHHYMNTTIGMCFLYFIGIPIVIYCLCYIVAPCFTDGWSIANVIKQNEYMYHYHANLHATHPYQSAWWEWLLDLRPMWYYGKEDMNHLYHSIVCMSHPLLTWFGLYSIVYTITKWIQTKDMTAFMIMVGYLSAFLPWVSFVQRCVFAYHFYPTSLFMICAIIYTIKNYEEKNSKYRKFTNQFTYLCIIVFLAFLPVLTGVGIRQQWIKYLEWFPRWYFG